MEKYKGIVKWNGNHYESGEEVIGSVVKFEDGKMYLYDDEPIDEFPYYGEARNQWVEIESFEKIDD